MDYSRRVTTTEKRLRLIFLGPLSLSSSFYLYDVGYSKVFFITLLLVSLVIGIEGAWQTPCFFSVKGLYMSSGYRHC